MSGIKMNVNPLSIIHPDSLIKNMPYDESIELIDSIFNEDNENNINENDLKNNINENDLKNEIDKSFTKIPRRLSIEIDLGDGIFDYISNEYERKMLNNAWNAITETNNWNFVKQDIESFIISNDPRINQISNKMEELGFNEHSGCSFGITMRNMQYIAQYGEDNFKFKLMK
jgi:hypothetical protein